MKNLRNKNIDCRYSLECFSCEAEDVRYCYKKSRLEFFESRGRGEGREFPKVFSERKV